MKANKQTLAFLTFLLVGGLISEEAHAQDPGTRAPVPHDQVISANPFLLLFEWVNVEYERKVSPTTTLGIGASHFSFEDGDEKYTGLNGFIRYYPQAAALSGFSLGGRLGFHSISDYDDEGDAFGLGVDLGYSWILGSKRNFYIGLGIGATRLFGGDIEEGRVVIPSIRLINVGYVF